MDALIEAPTATATARAHAPTVVAIVVVPDYVPVCFDQGVVQLVPSVNGAPLSGIHEGSIDSLAQPRLSSRGFVYVGGDE